MQGPTGQVSFMPYTSVATFIFDLHLRVEPNMREGFTQVNNLLSTLNRIYPFSLQQLIFKIHFGVRLDKYLNPYNVQHFKDQINATNSGVDFSSLRRMLRRFPSLQNVSFMVFSTDNYYWSDGLSDELTLKTYFFDVGWFGDLVRSELTEWEARKILQVSNFFVATTTLLMDTMV